MKLGNYQSLDKKSIQSVFIDYIGALEIPIIDYVAIGVQDTIHKTSTSMMSRTEWQKAFRTLGLAEHDPLRKASFTTKTNVFSFDGLDHQDSHGSEVMRQRRRYEIENGLVIMRKNLGHNFILTLATGYKNFLPYKFFIDKHRVIEIIFDDLIELVHPATEAYQTQVFNHHVGDAK